MDNNTEKKNNSKLKAVLMSLLFLVLLAAMCAYILDVFGLKDDKHSEQTFKAFYDQEDGSLDGVYLGSSAVYRYWVPTDAYQDKGMKIFNLGTGSQPVILSKYLIEETLKSQPNMKVIIVDIRSLIAADKRLKESDIRRVTDAMSWSSTRFEAIDASLAYFKEQGADIEYNKNYYYFPFLFYHNRWSDDLTPEDLLAQEVGNKYKGFVITQSSMTPLTTQEQPTYTDEISDMDPAKQEVLEDLLDYCDTIDQKVVFVSSPYAISEEDQMTLNAYMKLIKSRGYDAIDFNTQEMSDTLGIDWQNDFLDTKHVNYMGAQKYTTYLENYLDDKYDLPDHRKEDGTDNSWSRAADRVAKRIQKLADKTEQ